MSGGRIRFCRQLFHLGARARSAVRSIGRVRGRTGAPASHPSENRTRVRTRTSLARTFRAHVPTTTTSERRSPRSPAFALLSANRVRARAFRLHFGSDSPARRTETSVPVEIASDRALVKRRIDFIYTALARARASDVIEYSVRRPMRVVRVTSQEIRDGVPTYLRYGVQKRGERGW